MTTTTTTTRRPSKPRKVRKVEKHPSRRRCFAAMLFAMDALESDENSGLRGEAFDRLQDIFSYVNDHEWKAARRLAATYSLPPKRARRR